jgi:fructosamine-3-kinase
LFVKSLVDVPADDVFAAEAEGLEVLRERGGLATPRVVLATRELLVLSVLRARPAREAFWEQFARALAELHASTVHERFFDVYAELAGRDDDWRARMPIIQLRQHLAVIAQFDHDWGAAQQVRATLKPFRR